jgi:hypothetical protein
MPSRYSKRPIRSGFCGRSPAPKFRSRDGVHGTRLNPRPALLSGVHDLAHDRLPAHRRRDRVPPAPRGLPPTRLRGRALATRGVFGHVRRTLVRTGELHAILMPDFDRRGQEETDEAFLGALKIMVSIKVGASALVDTEVHDSNFASLSSIRCKSFVARPRQVAQSLASAIRGGRYHPDHVMKHNGRKSVSVG